MLIRLLIHWHTTAVVNTKQISNVHLKQLIVELPSVIGRCVAHLDHVWEVLLTFNKPCSLGAPTWAESTSWTSSWMTGHIIQLDALLATLKNNNSCLPERLYRKHGNLYVE